MFGTMCSPFPRSGPLCRVPKFSVKKTVDTSGHRFHHFVVSYGVDLRVGGRLVQDEFTTLRSVPNIEHLLRVGVHRSSSNDLAPGGETGLPSRMASVSI